MNDRRLAGKASDITSIVDELVEKIESLETELLEANERIDWLDSVIDEFNNIGSL